MRSLAFVWTSSKSLNVALKQKFAISKSDLQYLNPKPSFDSKTNDYQKRVKLNTGLASVFFDSASSCLILFSSYLKLLNPLAINVPIIEKPLSCFAQQIN